MIHTPEWVEQHRDEIERTAYQIHLAREAYYQPDDPQGNFLRAIEIVWERHQVARLAGK